MKHWLISLLAAMAISSSLCAAGNAVSLVGRWRFQLDRADAGVTERWFERVLPDTIKLPGSLLRSPSVPSAHEWECDADGDVGP
jgi:hypothetical protein